MKENIIIHIRGGLEVQKNNHPVHGSFRLSTQPALLKSRSHSAIPSRLLPKESSES